MDALEEDKEVSPDDQDILDNEEEDFAAEDEIPSSFRMKLMQAQVNDSLNGVMDSENFDTSMKKAMSDQKDMINEMDDFITKLNSWKTDHVETFDEELKHIDESDSDDNIYDINEPETDPGVYETVFQEHHRKYYYEETCKIDLDFEQLKTHKQSVAMSDKVQRIEAFLTARKTNDEKAWKEDEAYYQYNRDDNGNDTNQLDFAPSKISDNKVEITRIYHDARMDSNKMAYSMQEQMLLNELEMDRKCQHLSQALLNSSDEIDKIINGSG